MLIILTVNTVLISLQFQFIILTLTKCMFILVILTPQQSKRIIKQSTLRVACLYLDFWFQKKENKNSFKTHNKMATVTMLRLTHVVYVKHTITVNQDESKTPGLMSLLQPCHYSKAYTLQRFIHNIILNGDTTRMCDIICETSTLRFSDLILFLENKTFQF